MTFLLRFIDILFNTFTALILARVILSWFMVDPRRNRLVAILHQVTDLILAPLRRVIPRVGVFDFTPMIAVILIQLVYWLLMRLLIALL